MTIFNFFMQWILVFAFTAHSVSWGTLLSEGKIQEANAAFKASHLENFAVEYNKKFKNLDIMFKTVEQYYPKKSDVEYLKLAYKETNKTALEQKPAVISVKGSVVQITLPNAMLVSIEQVAPNVVKINGRDFKLDLNKPLKETHLEINKILEETLLSKNKFSFFKLILPEAEAFWPIIVAVGIFFVIPAAVYLAQVRSSEDSMNEALKACQTRDPKVPFNESAIYEKLQYLSANSIFSIEKQRQISDCASWAKAGKASAERRGEVAPVDDNTRLCLLGEKLMRCVDSYKAELAKASRSSGGNTKSEEFKSSPAENKTSP